MAANAGQPAIPKTFAGLRTARPVALFDDLHPLCNRKPHMTNLRQPIPEPRLDSHLRRRFIAFLNIEPGEERLIGLLILMYFILALGFVFVQSMAFGMFLSEYGVGGLPYSYILIAIVASLVAALYIKLGGKVTFSRLLYINLIFLGSASVAIWLTLKSPYYRYAAFILPLWFQIAINMGNLAVWPLAGSLFDFRQGKRLFPLLGAGNWLANIVGGLFIPALVNAIGAVNLLMLGGVSFLAGILILRLITRDYMQSSPAKPQAQRATRPVPAARKAAAPRAGSIFKDRYVALIFAYTLLWWVAFFFVDNIFYDRAYARFTEANQLTAFIGQLVSIMGIVALFSTTILTGRVITRFGLRAGLLAMPLIVIAGVGILAVSGSLGMSLLLVFALGSFAKMTNVAFGFSLSQSANAIVYQSLPDTIRGRVQAIAEGIVQPTATGVAGLSLLALTAGLKFNYIGLAWVFIGLGVVWLLVIHLLSRNYVQALTRVITKRRLGDDANVMADPDSLALLRGRLQDPHPAVAIYALNKLEALDERAVSAALPALLCHPAPEVRREALTRVERGKLRDLANAVQSQIAAERDPTVKEAGLRALGAILSGAQDARPLVQALHQPEPYARRGALIGLLKYANDSDAECTLEALLAAPSVEERTLAIAILGELDRRQYDAHLIAACDTPETSRAASLALARIGAPALPSIEAAFCQPGASPVRLAALAKALGHIGGEHAQKILLAHTATPNQALRSQIFSALSQAGYQTKDLAAIQRLIMIEAECAALVSASQVDLSATFETDLPVMALPIAALQEWLAQIRNRALLLLSFAFDGASIRRAREALVAGSPTQVSYALEILDTQIPNSWKGWAMPLLEDLPPEAHSQRLAPFFPQARHTPQERLQNILEHQDFPYWVRACAAHALARLNLKASPGEEGMLTTVEKVLILKTVSMFSQTPDNVLADVADLLEEMDVPANETIFNQGDSGDSLYVILDGKVRVHDGERLLNYLGERDVFGEMALLDPEPRLASVTTVEPTRLFRLDQSSFYALMSERPEVATGIIRVLTSRLRQRVRDIGQLNARIQALEDGSLV